MAKTIRVGRPTRCGWVERVSDFALCLLLAALLLL